MIEGLVFMLPGTGVETPGMGLRLLAEDPAFAAAIRSCDAAADGSYERPLSAFLTGEAETGGPGYRSAALAAFGIGIGSALAERGVTASLQVGCSIGEIAALVMTGALSLQEAFAYVAVQARAIDETVPPGALIFTLGDPDLASEVAAWRDTEIAGSYGPGLLLVAVASDTAQTVVERLGELGAVAQRLPMGHATHSLHIDPARSRIAMAAGSVGWRQGVGQVISSATGEAVVPGPDHLWKIVREPIHFDRAMAAAEASGARFGLDLGPTGSLVTAARRLTKGRLQFAATSTPADNGVAALDRAAAMALSALN